MSLTPEEERKRTMRNWAVAATLVAFVVVVFLVTVVKIGGNIAARSM